MEGIKITKQLPFSVTSCIILYLVKQCQTLENQYIIFTLGFYIHDISDELRVMSFFNRLNRQQTFNRASR